MLARPGGNRELLEQLAGGGGATALATWRQVAHSLDTAWRARREALEGLFAQHARVADWRAVGAIDADSILTERQGYAQLRAKLPDGGRPAALAGGG